MGCADPISVLELNKTRWMSHQYSLVPRLVVKPVEEGGPAIVVEVFRSTVVEPRVKLVDD